MTRTFRLVASRTLAILSVAAAIAIPWYGWPAFGVALALVGMGAVLVPRADTPPHERRTRQLFRAAQRRVVRHPWRMRHP